MTPLPLAKSVEPAQVLCHSRTAKRILEARAANNATAAIITQAASSSSIAKRRQDAARDLEEAQAPQQVLAVVAAHEGVAKRAAVIHEARSGGRDVQPKSWQSGAR